MIAGGDAAVYSAGYAFNVAPVTDNQPFFFFTLKLSNIFHPARAGKGMDWKVNMGVLVRFALLAISALALLAFLIVPLALAGSARGIEKLPLLYFVAISLRYILTEMVLIRRSNVCDYRGCFSHASGQWPGQSNVPIMDENRVSMAGRDSRYRGGQRGLLLRSAVVAHAPGGFGDRDQADVECAADRAVGVPNGDAVPHRIAGAGPEAWRQRGVGMGTECGSQRPGIGSCHRYRTAVWINRGPADCRRHLRAQCRAQLFAEIADCRSGEWTLTGRCYSTSIAPGVSSM